MARFCDDVWRATAIKLLSATFYDMVHDNSAGDDPPSPAKSVRNERKNWHCYHASDRINRVEETQGSTIRVVKVVFPICDRLKRVHHGPEINFYQNKSNPSYPVVAEDERATRRSYCQDEKEEHTKYNFSNPECLYHVTRGRSGASSASIPERCSVIAPPTAIVKFGYGKVISGRD